MAKYTLKFLRCEHRKIFKVCLAILEHLHERVKMLYASYGFVGCVICNMYNIKFCIRFWLKDKIFFIFVNISVFLSKKSVYIFLLKHIHQSFHLFFKF